MLEEIAKHCVPGAGPVELEPLPSGTVNRSFRATRAGQQFSLRLAAAEAGDLGLDRHWECRVRTLAADAGLAPPVKHCDPVQGVLVADWVSGRCWTPEEVRLPENMDSMAGLLRRVHALSIPAPARVMNPADWIARYALPGRQEDAALRATAEQHVAALESAASRALCHSDLHRLNVLVSDRPRVVTPLLLDWEYAHVSEPLWDVAGWIANNDWPPATAQRFLTSYLQRPVVWADTSRLEHLLWLYDYVCMLWSDRYSKKRPGAASGAIRARAAELTVRLTRGSGSRAG